MVTSPSLVLALSFFQQDFQDRALSLLHRYYYVNSPYKQNMHTTIVLCIKSYVLAIWLSALSV